MKLQINIPKEYEDDFKENKFEDAFQRLKIDAHELAGLYERETADMFIEAFKNAKVIE
jgi:hypothetical protein